MKDQILKELNEAKNVVDKFINDDAIINAIEESVKIMTKSIDNGGKIISCGNGGSMCDAMHFAEELTESLEMKDHQYPQYLYLIHHT